ncbi:MAG: type III-D CRISPR-associated protein Csx19 [Pyrinomonadaceae bacterium]
MSEQNRATLYIYTRKGLLLTDALTGSKDVLTDGSSTAVAMLYAISACHFARLDQGRLMDKDGKQIDLGSVYEARIFSDKAELRWLHREEGYGDAALLTEEKRDPKGWKEEQPIQPVGMPIEQAYLLWGESTTDQSRNDWTKMATSRIGSYFAPVRSSTNKVRVQLNAREYLSQDEMHGNVFVAEERWLNLSVIKADGNGKGGE